MAVRPKLTLPPEGRLAAHPLPGLLGTLGLVRATGVLDVVRKKLSRRFVLDGGALAALVANAREDRFFDWLLVNGGLGPVEPDLVENMRAQLAQSSLTAGALVAAGLVPADRVRELLTMHLEATLLETAAWGDATFTIRPGRVDLGFEPSAAWPAIDAALVLAREETAHARRALPLPPAIIAAAEAGVFAAAGLTGAEQAVIDTCAAGADPSTLGARLSAFPFAEIQAALGALWRAGLVVAADADTAAAVAEDEDAGELTHLQLERWLDAARREDYDVLLGVTPGADPGAVRKAYYRTVRRFHPDRFRGGPFAARHREIEQAFRLVNEALAMLTDPHARAEREARKRQADHRPSATAGAQRAAELFASAQQSLDQGRLADAARLLEQAAAMQPDEPSYALHASLLLLGNPARRRDATARLAQLAQQHANRADILAAYALGLAKAGRTAESAPMVRRALALDPQQRLARALAGDAGALAEVRSDRFLRLLF